MIEDWRNSIDHIDQTIINLLEQRFTLTNLIGAYKREHHIVVLDATRERQVLERVENILKNKTLVSAIKDVFTTIMKASRICQMVGQTGCGHEDFTKDRATFALEKTQATSEDAPPSKGASPCRLRVAYQGTAGAYAEEALNTYFEQYGDHAVMEKIPAPDFEGVVEGVAKGYYEFGVLPIENTTTGGVLPVYDLLQKHAVTIVGEVLIPIEHQLLVIPGTKLEDLQVIYSHPQALRQSRRYLRTGGWQLQPYVNTALSAQWVSKLGDKTKAAVGSKRAGEVYGLEVLANKINDHSGNMTRFIVLSGVHQRREDLIPSSPLPNIMSNKAGGKGKTSVVVTLPHVCGSLYRVIACLKEHQVNMLKIESRPLKDHPFEYSFHLDLEGYEHQRHVKEALKELREIAQTMKLLGSYTDYSGILKSAR